MHSKFNSIHDNSTGQSNQYEIKMNSVFEWTTHTFPMRIVQNHQYMFRRKIPPQNYAVTTNVTSWNSH